MILQLIIFVHFLQVVQAIQICTFLPPIVPLLNMPYQVRASVFPSVHPSYTLSACPSVFPSSTSTLFFLSSTSSLYVYDTLYLSSDSYHNVATSYHPIITLLNQLDLLPCKVLVNKYANILLVGRCLTLIFTCFALSSTQNNLILMCL